MTNRYIYALDGDRVDHSRWLELRTKADAVTLLLTDLCLPGRVSSLQSVDVSRDEFERCLANGALQVCAERGGYLLVRRQDDLLEVEFRGPDEETPCRARLVAEDVSARLRELDASRTALL